MKDLVGVGSACQKRIGTILSFESNSFEGLTKKSQQNTSFHGLENGCTV
jgi:hypothetical protein